MYLVLLVWRIVLLLLVVALENMNQLVATSAIDWNDGGIPYNWYMVGEP